MIGKLLLVLAGSLIATVVGAAPLTLTVTKGEPAAAEIFNMGTARRPDGMTLTVSRQSLLLNGQPWTPVMGEFHYSRYPANEWRAELLKMKAGGIDIVATYVFWIHHEEVEGVWEWSGDKNLRDFVLVDDAEMRAAAGHYLALCHCVAEISGAAALAGALKWREQVAGKKVGVILSGANLTLPQMQRILAEREG